MTPRLPLRNASAMASGICASAAMTFERWFCASALNSCSTATASARRSSALACAMRLSASAWSVWSSAPMFLPTSTSAMSIERISKAVPASRPLARTVLEMRSGFSSTALWDDADPSVDVGSDRDSSEGKQLNTVLGHRGHLGRGNDLRIHAYLHGLEHVTTREIDG